MSKEVSNKRYTLKGLQRTKGEYEGEVRLVSTGALSLEYVWVGTGWTIKLFYDKKSEEEKKRVKEDLKRWTWMRKHQTGGAFVSAKDVLMKMLGGACMDCDTVLFYPAMQFHHVDETSPSWRSGQRITYKKSPVEFEKLVRTGKIELLCANCHALRHARGVPNLKKEFMEYLGGECEECDYSDPRALVFHHRDERDKWSSTTFSGYQEDPERFKQDILEGKIALLCRNCHRLLHATLAQEVVEDET